MAHGILSQAKEFVVLTWNLGFSTEIDHFLEILFKTNVFIWQLQQLT